MALILHQNCYLPFDLGINDLSVSSEKTIYQKCQDVNERLLSFTVRLLKRCLMFRQIHKLLKLELRSELAPWPLKSHMADMHVL